MGAMPTSEEICFALSLPNSGNSEINVAVVAGPTPLMLFNKLARLGWCSARCAAIRRSNASIYCANMAMRSAIPWNTSSCAMYLRCSAGLR